LGLSVPIAFGGLGLDMVTTAHVMEAFGRGCPDTGLPFATASHLFACAMPVVTFGNEQQKQQWLPQLCSGQIMAAHAASEAEAGSDLPSLKARAVKDGDDYLISGEKIYVTNAPSADLFLVYASTCPENGYLGISAFLVERGRSGLSTGKPFHKLGLSSAHTGAVYFDEVRVPAAHRLGSEGSGLDHFNHGMAWERCCLFATYVGVMDRLLARAVDHACNRRQFRKPIGKNQAVSHRLVDMKMRLESARLLLFRAAWMFDKGEDATAAIAMSKLAISEAAVQNGIDTLRTFGGSGCMLEMGIAEGLLDALPGTIFSGTSDIQRNLIAREMGL
jgi:L-prolyl-PCP dehydrogenase